MEETKKGRCDTCGFLALRFWADTDLHEATQEFREQGVDVNAALATSRPPRCFVQAFRIDSEAAMHNKDTVEPDMSLLPTTVLAVIQKQDRHCSAWRRWILGLSPKEHREMMDRQFIRRWEIGARVAEILIVAVGVAIAAFFTIQAANIQSEAQRDIADAQMKFQQSLLATPTPAFVPIPTPTPASQSGTSNNAP